MNYGINVLMNERMDECIYVDGRVDEWLGIN
jgi:hypothetical protein